MTMAEIVAILEEDLRELPKESQYDEGFAAGVYSALFLIKRAAKENKSDE